MKLINYCTCKLINLVILNLKKCCNLKPDIVLYLCLI